MSRTQAVLHEHRDVLGVVLKDGRLVHGLGELMREHGSSAARARHSLTGNMPLTKTFKLLQSSQSRQSSSDQRVQARAQGRAHALRLARPPAWRKSSYSQGRLSACSIAYHYDLAVYLSSSMARCLRVSVACSRGTTLRSETAPAASLTLTGRLLDVRVAMTVGARRAANSLSRQQDGDWQSAEAVRSVEGRE